MKKKNNKLISVLVVIHDFPPYSYSGAPLFAYYISKELIELGVKIKFFYPRIIISPKDVDGVTNYTITEKLYKSIPVYELTLYERKNEIHNHPYFGFKNEIVENKFKQILEKNNFNLVHFHSIFRLSSGLPLVTKELKIPSCITLHDFWFLCQRILLINHKGHFCNGPKTSLKCAECFNASYNKSIVNKALDKIEGKVEKTILNKAYSKLLKSGKNTVSKLTTRKVSEQTDNFFKQRILETQKGYNAIDRVFSPSNYLAKIYETYGFYYPEILPYGLKPIKILETKKIIGNKVIFGFAGQLILRKGIDVFIEAIELLNKNNWQLLIYGNHQNDEYYHQVIKKVNNNKNIIYKGAYLPEELPKILSSFDVAVLPSRNDNYPISLLEALSVKIPAIISDAGGFTEVIKDKINSFIFPNENVEVLSEIIDKILENPDIITKMKEKIEPVKTMHENALEYLEIYKALIQ